MLLLVEHCLRRGRPAAASEYLEEADIDETLGSVIAQLHALADAEGRKAREARRRALKARLDDGAAGFSRACRLLAEPRHPPIATLRTGQGGYTTKPLELGDMIAEAWGPVFNPKEEVRPHERAQACFNQAGG